MKTAEHIIETVDKLVRKYHTRDPYELCQLLGIKIHYYDLQKKLKGFFYYQSRQKNIPSSAYHAQIFPLSSFRP